MGLGVIDDRATWIRLSAPPARLVSLVPSDTYTLLRLGAGARLVGRTRYCVEPTGEVEAIPIVGGVRDPDLAAVRALAPDVVVASFEDNRRADVAALESAGIPVLVGHPRTVRQGLEHARRLAVLLGETSAEGAERLVRAEALLGGAPEAAVQTVDGPKEAAPRPRVLVVLWPEPLVVLGADTHGADVLRLAGAQLLAPPSSGESYPRTGLGELGRLAPDWLLLPDEPHAFSVEEGEGLVARLGSAGAGSVRVAHCDGKDLFWYGLRALEGLERVRALLGGVGAGARR